MTETTAKKADRKTINARRKWIAALRSGKYRQTRGALWRAAGEEGGHKRTDSFCCLGVICHLNDKKFARDMAHDDLCSAHLPDHIQAVSPIPDMVNKAFAALNDDCGWSFKRIAALVEKHIELDEWAFYAAITDAKDAARAKKKAEEVIPW